MTETRACPTCGAQVPGAAAFCTECGVATAARPATVPAVSYPRVLAPLAAGLGVVIVAAVYWFLISRGVLRIVSARIKLCEIFFVHGFSQYMSLPARAA